jgi:hypothetical protein
VLAYTDGMLATEGRGVKGEALAYVLYIENVVSNMDPFLC